MKKNEKDTTFRFGIVKENGKDITIEITEEEYQRQLKAGVPENELLSVGMHKARRGGFRDRHPNLRAEDVEVRIINSKKDKEKKAA
jgi:hypothetical protein